MLPIAGVRSLRGNSITRNWTSNHDREKAASRRNVDALQPDRVTSPRRHHREESLWSSNRLSRSSDSVGRLVRNGDKSCDDTKRLHNLSRPGTSPRNPWWTTPLSLRDRGAVL